jgi:hypothetical protein
MDARPNRHCWVQFRLSTWFVLVGILGWAMTIWPLATEWKVTSVQGDDGSGFTMLVEGVQVTRLNLFVPALTLAAFLLRKTAWAVAERRRCKTGASE